MPIEHVNRKGDRYFLLQGTTKTGKPKYYFAKKPQGILVDTIPAGFEIRESPTNAQVTLRKACPTRILPLEREVLERAVRELAGLECFSVDIEDDSLVVYTPPNDLRDVASDIAAIFGAIPGGVGPVADLISRRAMYQAMLRFELINRDRRVFVAYRWCFRGSIDDWIPLGRFGCGESLENLAKAYLPHLGKESFYELM